VSHHLLDYRLFAALACNGCRSTAPVRHQTRLATEWA
jgi:hypothetical protein